MGIIKAIFLLIRAFLISRLSLADEILALRQQVAVYKHTVKRPELRFRERVFWVWLSRLWSNWRSALVIVQPETVIKWHRQWFKLYWRWKPSARKPGRPPIQRELRELIRRMSRENPLWGAPRILSELFLWASPELAVHEIECRIKAHCIFVDADGLLPTLGLSWDENVLPLVQGGNSPGYMPPEHVVTFLKMVRTAEQHLPSGEEMNSEITAHFRGRRQELTGFLERAVRLTEPICCDL